MTSRSLLLASVALAAMFSGGGRALAQAPSAQAGLGFLQLRGTADAPVDAVEAPPPPAETLAPPVEPGDRPVRENLRLAPVGTVEAEIAAGPDGEALNVPRPVRDDAGAFAAIGVRAGAFLVFPAMEAAIIAGGAPGNGQGLSQLLAPEIAVQSNWSRHELRLAARASLRAFETPGVDPVATLSADGTLRLDLAGGWEWTLTGAYDRAALSATDATYPAGADAAPLVHTGRFETALARVEGPLTLRLSASAERTRIGNTSVAGVPVDLGDRGNLLSAGTIRVGYEATPLLQPFIEASVGLRVYDRAFDQAGFRQSGAFSAIRAGIAAEPSPLLNGELAVGWRREEHDDPRLPALEGPTFDGRAVWSPTRLDTITVTAATSFQPTATETTPGTIAFEAGFVAEHAGRHDMTLSADGCFRTERFVDSDRVDVAVTAGAQMSWRISRRAVLTTRYAHDWIWSPEPGRTASYDTVEVRLRLQR